jgi:3-oxoacyl-[acyl-carrier protein] reductase
MAYRCDVSDFQQAKETVAQIKADLGTVNILVNNAGVTKDGLIATMKEQDFDAVVDTNLKGAFNMIRHCCGLFIRNRGGRIVNVSSVSGMIGNAGQANYSASKAGIIGLTKATAKELAPRGITCNAVAPGFVETDMTRSLALDEEKIAAAIPLGRLAKPEEIADAVAFLVSADYITGEVLRVDGGIAM